MTTRNTLTLTLDNRLILSGMWIVQMMIYFLGDVLRIYSGDAARMTAGIPEGSIQWLLGAIVMLVPITMVLLSLVLRPRVNRWVNIIAAVGFFLFIVADLRSYPGIYDQFLFAVSMVLYVVQVVFAWRWSTS
jgi:hypothetical protein